MSNIILEKTVAEEMKSSYIDYAMSVIVSRALPDVRDGLKPVHRRILYTLWEEGMTHNASYRKSARVSGLCMGKYHPHGDAAIYDTMVRMAQPFSMRYPLIDGQGNFGSIDGDPAAAARYTEVRLTKIAEELLIDLERNTVVFNPNYDGSLEEPIVLPAKLPNLLLNGSVGIAVGMATNIPPHNIKELVDAICLLIDNPDAHVPDIMNVLTAPDFPTGGTIVGRTGILQAYQTGKGAITIRSKAEIENGKRHDSIVVTELPYQVNKSELIESISDLVKSGTITGISDIRDESDKDGIRLVIEAKSGTDANLLLSQLYKATDLEKAFNINMVVLVDGVPYTVSIKNILDQYISHRETVITKRTQFDLSKAKERLHILEGLLKALGNIDRVVKIIRGSNSPTEARESLILEFSLSNEQVRAILDMKLQRLTSLESEKIKTEAGDLSKEIDRLGNILSNRNNILNIIKEELTYLKNEYGDNRRTDIIDVANEADIDVMIPDEDVIVTLTADGYIKRQLDASYKTQNRGGKGSIGADIKTEDCITGTFPASTKDNLLVFTDKGRVHWLKVYEIPQIAKNARGKHITALLDMRDENVVRVLPVKDFSSGYIMAVMSEGKVVRMKTAEFANPRKGGVKAINLREDKLRSVILTSGNDDVMIATKHGKAIRFNETVIDEMGRFKVGVIGIRLNPGDEVVSMDSVREGSSMLTMTTSGYGKRTQNNEFEAQARGGKGVLSAKLAKNFVVAVISVKEDDEILVTTKTGIMIRLPVSSIRDQGRTTQGVRIMDVAKDDVVTSIAKLEL
jgi:DNA gyrase subunit A